MSYKFKLAEDIQSLSDIEKLKPVDSILIKYNPKIDRIWAEEASKRWEAYKSGKLETVSYKQVMSRYKKKMNQTIKGQPQGLPLR